MKFLSQQVLDLGNLIFEKRYHEAIALGIRLLESDPTDCMVHISLMDAYFRGRSLASDYFDRSTEHARLAILFGHNTGYAYDRLAKNLEKSRLYYQFIQLYNLILENKEFRFSKHGIGNHIDFAKRKETTLRKLDKALDSEAEILFSPHEIQQIIQSMRNND